MIALTFYQADANDSCRILLNDQVIFKGQVEQENATALIRTNQFKETDCLKIVYYSENPSKGWNRTFYLNGTNDENLKTIDLKKQNGSVSVKASVLNKMKAKRQPVFIYTMSLPTDKAMAARVRVRRIFICKMEWN
jgi:hypothetical protein